MEKVDYLIIGGGIVGLSTAYQILKENKNINLIVLEKEDKISMHQTGRNSGVIHSGLYYKPGSLKAINCIKGRKELLDFCLEFEVPFEKSIKLIVAADERELPGLQELEKKGIANGVEGLEVISKEEAKEIEPHIDSIQALKVPNCQIIDYLDVSKELRKQIEYLGGKVLLNQRVIGIDDKNDEILINTQKDSFRAKKLINAAGLYSDRIAKMAMPNNKIPIKIIPFRGEYYELKDEKKHLVKGLVYPVPDPKFPFLGVHLTKMIDGSVHAGPNAVFAFSREGYKKRDINFRDLIESLSYPGFIRIGLKYWKMGLFEMYRSFSKKAFLKSLQRMLSEIEIDDIVPGPSGIRAQAVDRKGKLLDDFEILKENNQVHVLNAPSPAATASFAIGRHIASLATKE
ncbi:MAG: L-2-hydroxyglutarate oxidase LhgO [Candidatus Anoxychlamydiales bacterium]|nr:L-2-hydroxyglutarate oxidase LhgO [Candidatus Anoxychlamydiales bacterium]NGX36027.1 L-2-hydroxyglutarate oxidase LhgO [Candidatus Anoxychlamydiales bacterium]